ncbi:MAG: hypothetical protein KA586_07495 [Candidatus Promineofilum sp.]|nr:hypothetical protein [Promineifilum sp.]
MQSPEVRNGVHGAQNSISDESLSMAFSGAGAIPCALMLVRPENRHIVMSAMGLRRFRVHFTVVY